MISVSSVVKFAYALSTPCDNAQSFADIHSPIPVHSCMFLYNPFQCFRYTSFVCTTYKKMPRICKYIQSFTWVCLVKSSIESCYVYQH
jgi:hypothetical protein